MKLIVNDTLVHTDLHPATRVLDFVRDELKLKGTKEGCGEGECGACTVLVGELCREDLTMKYRSFTSCLMPLGELNNKHLVTIEGVNMAELNSVQKAMVENSASQCGFCSPGIVLSLTGYFLSSDRFSLQGAVTALDGNICRCTGYESIKRSAKLLIEILSNYHVDSDHKIDSLVKARVLPGYFSKIPGRIASLVNASIEETHNTYVNNTLIAGGTDIYLQVGDRLTEKDVFIISNDKRLREIKKLDGGSIKLGAGVSTEDIRNSRILNEMIPSIADDLKVVSSTSIRNAATLGGNLINASPIGDLIIYFMPLGANVILEKDEQERVVPIEAFYKRYRVTDMLENEIMTAIKLPQLKEGELFSFEKVSNRKYLDIASCNSAMKIKAVNGIIESVSISAGGVAEVPMLLEKTTGFLSGKRISFEMLHEAADIIDSEISPISDIRGSESYKRKLIKHLFYGHFLKLFPELISYDEVVI